MTAPRTATALARLMAALGLLCTTWYLGWRVVGSMHGTTHVVSILLLIVELFGFVGSCLLVWATWRTPPLRAAGSDASERPCDVAIRVRQQRDHDIVASVTAIRRAHNVGDVFLLICGTGAARNVDDLARGLGVAVRRASAADRTGVATAVAAASTDAIVILDAGDIASVDAIGVLRRHLDDPMVGAVQAGTITIGHDELEHGPNGMHHDSFERHTLNPTLSVRGAGMLTGTAMLIRKGAIDSLLVGLDELPASEWLLSMALMNDGWTVAAAIGEPVVVVQPVRDQHEMTDRSIEQARSARQMAFGRGGACRSRHLTLAQRAGLGAWAVRPLSSFRRAMFVGILVSCLIGGYVPMQPNVTVIAAAWLPGFMLTSLGIAMLSGWSLRPGDRARGSLRHLGDALHSLHRRAMAPVGGTSGDVAPLTMVIGVIAVAVSVRAASERVTGALGPLPEVVLEGLLAVSLWVLALALDSLRLFNRRTSSRRAGRVATSIPALVGDTEVHVLDVAPLGIGVETVKPVAVGTKTTVSLTVTTSIGPCAVMTPAIVRNVVRANDRKGRSGVSRRWRMGLEFVDPPLAVTEALVDATMLDPALSRLEGEREAPALPNPFDLEPLHQGRLAYRAGALATIGAVAAGGHYEPRFASVVLAMAGVLATALVVGVRRPQRSA